MDLSGKTTESIKRVKTSVQMHESFLAASEVSLFFRILHSNYPGERLGT